MNSVNLMGRITSDLAVKEYNGTQVLRFSIAVPRDKNNTYFIPCVAFGGRAQTISVYFKKGNRIAVNGRLSQSSYTDREGKKREDISVIVDGFDFIESKTTSDKGKMKDFEPPMPKEDFAQIEEDIPF